MASEMVTLPAEAITDLRRMLAIGMAALAELERVDFGAVNAKLVDENERDQIVPVHPTGAEEMGSFATAFRWLDIASPVEA